jgi:hypothetical protein
VHEVTVVSPDDAQLELTLQRQLALKLVTDLQQDPPDGFAHVVAVDPEFSDVEQLHDVVPDCTHERLRQ